jgi:hypothetical protein
MIATGLAGAAVASPRPPFTDPSAVGYIGLCNEAGHQITSGNIDTTPFAWRAVSSQAAPAPYNNAWRTAILLAYQPRQGLPPGEWSGDELTASSRYTNPAHPMVAATHGDDSLEDFIQEFHPVWDGYLQLRIYLGTQNAEVYSVQYPGLDIRVTGDTWQAVGGGPVNCHSGTAESLESVVLPKSATSPPTTIATATATGSKASVASTHASSSSGFLPTVIVILAVLLVLAVCAYFIIRRRHAASHPSMAGTTRRS